jgi:hypothetical protein
MVVVSKMDCFVAEKKELTFTSGWCHSQLACGDPRIGLPVEYHDFGITRWPFMWN